MKKKNTHKKLTLLLISFSLVLAGCNSITNSTQEENVNNPSSSENLNTYVISFISNGGTPVDSAEVKEGHLLEKPVDPTKNGFEFDGWYKNSSLTTLYDFSTPVKSSFILYAGWKVVAPETWTVNFISNGTILSTQEVADCELLIEPNNPVRDGYEFIGWFKNGSSVRYNFATPVTSSFDLYAKWSTQEYMVTFNLNYDNLSEVQYSTEDGLVTFIPERNGYVFNGWWYCDGVIDGKPILNRSFSMNTKVTSNELELFAEWIEEKQYSNQLDAPSVSIDGYSITWNTVANANGYQVVITATVNRSTETFLNTKINGLSYTFDSSLDANTYTIKVRANGDGYNYVNSAYTTKTYAHKTLSSPRNYSYNSYKCILQWDEVLNATGYTLKIDKNNSISCDTNYYDFTNYDAGSHTIKVTATRENWISSSSSFTFSKLYLKTPINLSATFNENTGYYNVDWNAVEKADSYKIYINDLEVQTVNTNSYSLTRNSSYFVEERLNLAVAAFDSNSDYFISPKTESISIIKKYRITYNLDGGINNPSNPEYYDIDDNNISLTEPSKEGYTFLGWNQDNILVDVINTSLACDISLTALWNGGNEYTITLDPNGGNISTNSIIVHFGESYDLPTPTYVGFTFVGWYDGSTKISSNGTWEYTTDKTFVASWTTKTFNIEINCNNPNFGKLEGTGVYGYGSEVVLVATPYIGRKFDGWYINGQLVSTEPKYEFVINDDASIPSASFSTKSEMFYFNFNSTETTCSINYVESSYSNVESLVIPDYVTSVNRGALSDCVSLQTLTMPFIGGSTKNNQYLGYLFGADTYSNNSKFVPFSLKTIILSEACSYVPANAFNGCYSITTFSFSDNLTSIGSYAFKGCTGSISWSNNPTIKEVGNYAFAGYVGSSISIPASVNSIGEYAFLGCTAFTSFVVPDTVSSIGLGAFKECNELQLITIPFVGGSTTINRYFGYIFGAKNVDNNADYIPTSLNTVIISNNCSTIGNNAFKNCSTIASIVLGSNVASIGTYAFSGCSASISWTNNNIITSIGNYAFQDCSGETIVIPESVTSIGHYAFQNCSNIKSIVIPENVTSIGKYAFSGCENLTSITIPNNVTIIDDYAFENCAKLTSIIIGNSVTTIGKHSFAGCSSLTSVVVPNNVTTIGSGAFYGCSSLESITLPFVGNSESATTYSAVFGFIFGYATARSSANYDWTAGTFGVFKDSKIGPQPSGTTWQFSMIIAVPDSSWGYLQSYYYYIPESLQNVKITNTSSISTAAFMNCNHLSNIDMSSNITIIGNYAFSGCTGLDSISIPNTVESIGNYAFRNCAGLTSFVVPDNVTSIGYSAFYQCSSLQTITLPFVGGSATSNGYLGYIFGTTSFSSTQDYIPASLESVVLSEACTSIPANAFRNCSNIKTIIIPERITSIGSYAFSGCTGLSSIHIPNNVTSIGNYAFQNCSAEIQWGDDPSIKTIGNYAFAEYKGDTLTIPDSITSIGNYAFADSTYLATITIPNGVKTIGDYAFSGCTGLTCICIPNSVTTIGKYAFQNCSAEIQWGDDPSYNIIGNYTFSDYNVTSLIIPNSITSIEKYAFYGNTYLESIIIPDSVTTIGERAFYNCTSLKTLYIGDSVESIGILAFYGCSNLYKVTIGTNVSSVGTSAFEGCYKLTLVVNKSSLNIKADSSSFYGYLNYYIVKVVANENEAGTFVTDQNGFLAFDDGTDNWLISYEGNNKSIVIPNNITKIHYGAFYKDQNLNSVTVPDSVTNIGDYAFYDCQNLSTLVLGKNVEKIGNYAFYSCKSLTSVYFPDKVYNLGNYSFAKCTLLESISIGTGNGKRIIFYEGAFYDCTSLTDITYRGTMSQWQSNVYFNRRTNWAKNVPATVVHCSDGDVNGLSNI